MSKPPFLDAPTGLRAYRLGTARGEFAAHELGTARRGSVLLVPGFTGSKEDFIALLAPLAEAGYRVLAVDGRGQYQSPGPRDERAYAPAELALDVLEMARTLAAPAPSGPGGPVPPLHLVGHSLGGLIARRAVLRDPGRFASLTLMSSGPAGVAPGQRERLRMLREALPTLDMPAIWEAMRALDPPDAEDPLTPPAITDFLRERWLATVPEQLSATAQQLMDEPDRVAELATAGPPLHVVSGEVDDNWPVPWLDEMAVRLGARRTTVPGAGHSPNAERPAETAAALLDFWARDAERPTGRGAPASARAARARGGVSEPSDR
ncbi:alpha/beta fold hydrolase [Streptomyces sp. AJS327]|uniref:alpha/beta fold hydrolase n=1 Tax=Streptomyces sp. AJS327 TaxID=2545265 RepID=UPI0015DF8E2A|nr:alpha/beta fold hydrolase [Streptomyces sp. AJS327]MBA0051439.1 alpha/beta fold hydrolase [Streptomyces sp. AJS327]